jgi:hypothetical protein
MARISFQFQERAGEVERHIDRTNGAPTFQAAMRGDDGIKQFAHVGDAFLFSITSSSHTLMLAAALRRRHVDILLRVFAMTRPATDTTTCDGLGSMGMVGIGELDCFRCHDFDSSI